MTVNHMASTSLQYIPQAYYHNSYKATSIIFCVQKMAVT